MNLRCRGIAKSFGGRAVLRGVDLEVGAGTLTAILGSSGSGKTTLLRVIAGFIAPDLGDVLIGDSAVAGAGRRPMAPDKRGLGYVAQEGALYPHLRVGENVGFGLPRRERKHSMRIAEVLELVGLDPRYVDRWPHELSGGEQRRVALARALAPMPRLVLLDEPFSGLDASLRVETREAVLRALAQEGSTTVMVTHDQAEALSMGHEVAVLREGVVVQTAAPEVLYRTPADLGVARFVGDAIVLRGEARGGLVTCPLGTLPVLDPRLAGTVLAMVRPEQIRLTRHLAQDERHALKPGTVPPLATVLGHTRYGPDTVVKLALHECRTVAISARTFERELPEIGETVHLSVVGPVVTYPESLESTAEMTDQRHDDGRHEDTRPPLVAALPERERG